MSKQAFDKISEGLNEVMSRLVERQISYARYEAETSDIRASADNHPQVVGMALNEARRQLDRDLEHALPDPVTPSITTLGEKLKHNIAEAERLRLDKEERANRAARERREQRMREVSQALDLIKSKISASIEEGSIPAPMRLPRCLDKPRFGSTPVTSADHELYDRWRSEMESWAKEQGLALGVVYDHDGAGMDSWWNLTVTPM